MQKDKIVNGIFKVYKPMKDGQMRLNIFINNFCASVVQKTINCVKEKKLL